MTFPIRTRTQVETIAPYVLGQSLEDVKKELGLTHIRKMSENENVYGTSPLVKQIILGSLDNLHLYPDGAVRDLRLKLAEFYGLDANQFILGNGSDELIRVLTRTYISLDDEAVMGDVTFPRYKTNVLIEGGKPVIVPLVNGVHDLKNMLSSITNRTKMIFVCNPNNPTGTIVGREELLQFIESVPQHILIVLDEAYYEYVTSEDYLESIPLLDQHPNLVILRTFSKIYGLASLRIGYGIAHQALVGELLKVKEVFNANGLAQISALAALEDQEFIISCTQQNEEERIKMQLAFSNMGLPYFPSQTNFIMVDTKTSGETVSRELLKRGFVVRSGHLLGYASMFRVTLGTCEDNEAFRAALSEILSGKVE
ncbi:histidinol-phosphate transaminase [Peribacillus acanthi]|uniref:histidinol-phosphate transaminase n=1 Tax=Peribacillus acanthi TaxID=2171554 RepID=UPI000D3E204C|nr:histidinol-phosphate transaminase [Peribacillus acanthi]